MQIALRGIIQFYDNGHKYVDVVVTEDKPYLSQVHRLGVDIKVNRGKIITFLSGIYGIPPGQIVWPEHIMIKASDD